MVHLKMITVNKTNAIQETGVDLQLCKHHNKCGFKECQDRPVYLIQCGHMFCLSHYTAVVHTTLCEECGITLCGAIEREYDHKPCGISTIHYLCNQGSNLEQHTSYYYDIYFEKHKRHFSSQPGRKFKFSLQKGFNRIKNRKVAKIH